ncbi:MAG: type II toxin-antitoxin system RelE/ParE family toxin, partial [Planctomycetota bacterium]
SAHSRLDSKCALWNWSFTKFRHCVNSILTGSKRRAIILRWMEVEFGSDDLDRLEIDPHFTGGWPPAVVKAYRKRLNFIRQAHTKVDLYAWKSLRLEKLKGERQHRHSMRLNDQWRLVIEFKQSGPNEIVRIVAIEDYH